MTLPVAFLIWIVFVDLRHPDEVDEELRDWLTEAYLSSPL